MSHRNVTIAAVVLAAMGAASCAGGTRFVDRPAVWRVNDAKNIPEPEAASFYRIPYYADQLLFRRVTRSLELPNTEPARNTNAVDEVPDSSWFTNRIGVRQVTPEEAALGASAGGPPKPPIEITGGKGGGMNPGFMAKDATGRKFLVKFDTKENPGMQTANSAIVNRIFWTIGYSVPNDGIIVFRRADLRLDPKARLTDALNRKRPLTWDDVDEILDTSPRRADGAIRASASEFLPGVPKGGFSPEGIRDDDPNDRIPHQHRRELRGLRVFCAWVNHTDIKPDNTLDTYVEEHGRRYLKHSLIDFGEALGGLQAEANRLRDGYEHTWDWSRQTRAFLAFGLWKRPWEGQSQTPWLSVGAFSADTFDPTYWREAATYAPFSEMEAADAYWAAKIVMRFDRPILEAIVAEGQLSHPEAAKYLVDTLLARRDKVGKAYIETVTPLDRFQVRGDQVCTVDLGVLHGLATSGTVEALDEEGAVRRELTVGPRGEVCIPLPRDDAYSIYRLRTARGRDKRPPMQLHVRGGSNPRILGIIRVE
jgi:hypothetical protein